MGFDDDGGNLREIARCCYSIRRNAACKGRFTVKTFSALRFGCRRRHSCDECSWKFLYWYIFSWRWYRRIFPQFSLVLYVSFSSTFLCSLFILTSYYSHSSAIAVSLEETWISCAISRLVTSDTQSLSWHHFNSNCEHSRSWIPAAASFECIRRRQLLSSPSMSLYFIKMQDVDAVDTFRVFLCWLVMSNNQTIGG